MKTYALSAVLAALFFTASCGGGNEGAQKPAAAAPSADGEAIYKRVCAVCHQMNGMGIPGTYPPLAKSDFLANREKTIRQVIKGSAGEITVNGVKFNSLMPPQPLSDDEVAAVLTYVYSSFGNSGGPVTAADAKAAREKQ